MRSRRISPNESAPAVELPSSETDNFAISASIRDGVLSIALTGRLDTITAPNLLAFFKSTRKKRSVEAVGKES